MPEARPVPPETIRAALAPDFAALRAFMDRRIAELSAEVSASSTIRRSSAP